MGIEDAKVKMRKWLADNAAATRLRVFSPEAPKGHVHGGLRDAIHVDQVRTFVAAGLEPWQKLWYVERFATKNQEPQPAQAPAFKRHGHELPKRGRSLAQNGDLFAVT